MHKYYTYKISLKNYEEIISREFRILDITELSTLAYSFLASLNCIGKKEYYFNINDTIYECDEGISKQENKLIHKPTYIALARLENIDLFSFVYDYENKYEFIFKKIKEEEESKFKKNVTILDGKGYGLLDDCPNEFIAFLNGDITFEELKNNTKNKKIKEFNNFDYIYDIATYNSLYYKIKRNRDKKF